MSGHRPWSEVRAERTRRRLDVVARWFGADVVYADLETGDPGSPSGYVVLQLVPGGVPLVVGHVESTPDAAWRRLRRLEVGWPRALFAVAEVGPPLPSPVNDDDEETP